MKKVAMIPLALGVIIGGLAIKLGLNTLQKAKASGHQQLVEAVIATVDIPATSEIDRTMVTIVKTPTSPLLGNDSFSTTEELIGRVASSSIPRGALVRGSLLAPEGTAPGLTVRIAPGFRALSVKIDEVIGVAYQIRPGTFVDVVAVMDIANGARRETVSRVILQRVEVAAVGRALNVGSGNSGKGKAARSVTLLVRNADVPRLHLAQTRGKLTLALRNKDDNVLGDAAYVSERELLGGSRPNESEGTESVTARTVVSAPKRTNNLVVVTVFNGGQRPQTLAFDGPTSMRRHPVPGSGDRRSSSRNADGANAQDKSEDDDNESQESEADQHSSN